jgi:hypothetical protein
MPSAFLAIEDAGAVVIQNITQEMKLRGFKPVIETYIAIYPLNCD